jgi:hypothetical protein
MVETAFGIFAVICLALFRFLPAPTAVATTCFAGSLLLPVGNYPPGSASAVFPYWITGTAIPSDMLLTKMWWPPVVALVGALLIDRSRIREFRLNWVDLPMLAWCLWPLLQALFVEDPDPPSWVASLYLSASWGAPWLLGRIYFAGSEGYRLFLVALIGSLVVILPIALVEGVGGPKLYGWLYEPHPFRFDGIERYIGFRPLGFFEDGNQYGIWVAVTALAALWLPLSQQRHQREPWLIFIALVAALTAFASQSVGAMLLLLTGISVGIILHNGGSRWVLGLVLLLLMFGGAVYLSGKLPLRSFAENTTIGRHAVEFIRGLGRGSLTWRIARDQEGLVLLSGQTFLGTGHWDWWRASGQRPWSLVMLVVGEFGIVGLLLVFGAGVTACLRGVLSRKNTAVALAAIVAMAIGDALFNSFFLYPAILAAGGLASPDRSDFKSISREVAMS